MEKTKQVILVIFLSVIFLILVLNLKVVTRQGIDYAFCNKNIPLYLKILSFYDRHFQYKQLAKEIIYGQCSDEEKALKIFEWTHKNIRKVPLGFPVVDDHVWHIIVRGYGTNDQFSDVFCTLCNYARLDAFYSWVYTRDRAERIPFSFVKLEDRWVVFDPFNGLYFINSNGRIASTEEIRAGDWRIKKLPLSNKEEINYEEYLSNLPTIKYINSNRSNIQSPLRRFMYQIKKIVLITQNH